MFPRDVQEPRQHESNWKATTSHEETVAAQVSLACAGLTATLGLIVMCGWIFHIEGMKAVLPNGVIIIPNTALCMMLTGAALALTQFRDLRAIPVSRTLAGVVALLGTAAFLERTLHFTLPTDLLLFPNSIRSYPYDPPGIMARNSATCFVFGAVAIILLGAPSRHTLRVAHSLALAGLGIAFVAIMGHAFDARPLYAVDQAAGMAMLTATSVEILHLGILLRYPRSGFASLIVGRDRAGVLLRQVLPAAVLLPLVFGWLWIWARREQLISREGGVALFSLLTVVALVVLIVRSAVLLRTTDQARAFLLESEAEARIAAEAMSRSKSEFLATMSTEFRTPLNAIIGYASLLLDGIPAPASPPQREQLLRIDVSARQLLSLIEDVVAMTHLEGGEGHFTLTPIRLGSLIKDVSAIADPLVHVRDLRFVVEVRGGETKLTTDAARLRQILLNLLVNAVKFTDKGTITLNASIVDGKAIFSVRDSGIGIRDEHLTHIFEPFFQVDQARTRVGPGSGLGLAVARRLVKMLHGTVSVESKYGEGSLFTVIIPVTPLSTEFRISRESAAIPS